MSETTTNVTGKLKHGLVIDGTRHVEFEMREALAGDYFDAEQEAVQGAAMTYRSAVLARQLVRLGSYTGPFTLTMLRQLKGRDLSVLLAKQQELDALGEGEQPG